MRTATRLGLDDIPMFLTAVEQGDAIIVAMILRRPLRVGVAPGFVARVFVRLVRNDTGICITVPVFVMPYVVVPFVVVHVVMCTRLASGQSK